MKTKLGISMLIFLISFFTIFNYNTSASDNISPEIIEKNLESLMAVTCLEGGKASIGSGVSIDPLSIDWGFPVNPSEKNVTYCLTVYHNVENKKNLFNVVSH